MSQAAIKPSPLGNVLAARVAAQARTQAQTGAQLGQPAQSAQPLLPRPPVSLTLIRPSLVPAQPQLTPVVPTLLTTTLLAPGQLATAELDQQFRGAVRQVRNSLAAAAYYGYRLLAADDWPSLGYDSAEHYYTEQGLSEALWKRYTTIGERLQHISLSDMQSLRISSADALSKVHPDLWPEYAWVEEAKLLPTREFEILVSQRNREHQPTASQLAEPRITMSVSVPVSQQSLLERRLQSLRRRAKLATTGDTLIFALEAADRAGLLEEVLGSVQQAVAELGRLWKPESPWSAGLQESAAEQADRLEHGEAGGAASLIDAAARSQQLTRAILRALRDLDLQPQAPPATKGAAADAPDQETLRPETAPEQRQAS
jgi:hypothetical protein